MVEGKHVTLTMTDISPDGRGIARLDDGRIVFVQGALPGQEVTAVLEEEHAHYATARLHTIRTEEGLDPALCAVATRCGGCPLQRLPRPRQLAWKEASVRTQLTKIGHLDYERVRTLVRPIAASPNVHAFRNKVTYAIGQADELLVGFRGHKSHTVVEPKGCILIPKEVEEIRASAQEELRKSKLPAYTLSQNKGFWRHLVLRASLDTTNTQGRSFAWWLYLLTSRANTAELRVVHAIADTLMRRHPKIAACVHDERERHDLCAIGERRRQILAPGDSFLTLPLKNRVFALDISSFFQVNTSAAEILADKVSEAVQTWFCETQPEKPHLVDLYCGVGAPGLLIADRFHDCDGIEVMPLSVRFARKNAERFGLTNYRVRAGACTHLFPSTMAHADSLVLVDPPRTGLDQESRAYLLTQPFSGLVYVSCNPATLARDLGLLAAAYDIVSVSPVDLFPHTAHVESCSLLLRKS